MEPLAKLEDRLVRAVELFKKNQAERRALEKEIEELRADFKERLKKADALEREVQALHREREEVRARVERVLQQIEALTKNESRD